VFEEEIELDDEALEKIEAAKKNND